jgi:hypothetical protein
MSGAVMNVVDGVGVGAVADVARAEKMPPMGPAPTRHPTKVAIRATIKARARVRERGQVQDSAATPPGIPAVAVVVPVAEPVAVPAAAVVALAAAMAAAHRRPSRHRASGRRHPRHPRRLLFQRQAPAPITNTSFGRPLRATCRAPVLTTGRRLAPTTAVCARSPVGARADASSRPRWYPRALWRVRVRQRQPHPSTPP